MIVFGWNTFKLASFKPSSVDLPKEMDTQVTIERKQKYFHLFWIPFFPIGQVWTIKKKGDSNTYEPTTAINQYLDSLQLTYKTPWYTFALPLLAMAIGVIYFVQSEIKSYQWKKQYEADQIVKKEQFLSLVKKGETNTYLLLNNTEGSLYLKVIGSDANTLKCVSSNINDSRNYSNYVLAAFIIDEQLETGKLDTITVQKKDLISAYNATGDSQFETKINLPDYGACTLNEFRVIDYPVFEFGGASYKDGNYMCTFKNIGASVKKMKFQQRDDARNNLVLDSTLFKNELQTGDNLILMGKYTNAEPVLMGNLLVLNDNNKIDTCSVYMNGVHAGIEKKENRN